MICQLTIPGITDPVYLAGGGLIASEATGLKISSQGSPQVVEHIGAREARQFFRGGSLTTASFSSTREFSSTDVATQFIIDLQSSLANAYQKQCTALIAKRINKVTVSGSLTPNATGVLQETGLNTKVYDSYEIAASYPRKLLRLDTSGTATAKLEYFANSGQYPGSPSHTWTSTTAGSDATDPAGFTSWSSSGGTPAFAKAATDSPAISLYDCAPSVTASQIGVSVNMDVSLVGRLAAP
tara:strand:- start:975 stop:1694 length:720 start_codon:yes stop_codon:yes gene_type:complete